jgi:hypothetical protein
MKKIQLAFALTILLEGKSFAQSPQIITEYVLKFKDIAIEEMKRTWCTGSHYISPGYT